MREILKNEKVLTLIIFGFLIHILILKAAFDIYFSSPIDNGMSPIKSTNNPPAKRVVFMVADGLRAQTLFDNNDGNAELVAPNLRMLLLRSAWGVSHTRVPTESRPGHVALFGGIYEDPSAILKGWKVNPVDFDSVINQSTNAWCWGAPSIINMFNRDNSSQIHLYSYESKMEDFGNNNTIGLDEWVFDHVESFIKEQQSSLCIHHCREFYESGNLFFLHLLGTDTAGHAFKPNSEGYNGNIKYIDKKIVEIEKLFKDTFQDNATAFIFTADHGMTDWGSHGAGSDHETQTPFIAWGAGIKEKGKSQDIEQVDIAPMISALLGINYPINSLGRLPVDHLDVHEETLTEMLMSNILQLVETFTVKQNRRKENALRFVPFHNITENHVNVTLEHLKALSATDFDLFKTTAARFMGFLIEGADYYHNYYQLSLLISLTVGIIAWIIFLATFNITPTIVHTTSTSSIFWKHTEAFIFVPVYLNVLLLIYIQALPAAYYLYFLFPIVMIQINVRRNRHFVDALKQIKQFGICNTIIHIVMYSVGIKLLVHGFHQREVFSIVMYLMAAFIFWSQPLQATTSRKEKILWVCWCIMVSIFPLLPVMKTTFKISTYLSGYFFWWIFFQKYIIPRMERHPGNKLIVLQLVMFVLTPVYTLSVEFGYVGADSLLKNWAFIWALFPLFLLPLTSTRIFTRLTCIFMSFAVYYLMVASNYEILFILCYVCLLYTWILIESKCFGYNSIVTESFTKKVREDNQQRSDDFRRAFYFIALIFMGFFGTGNIASLNSFDPMWVRCFLTVFSPFKMSFLILLKIMVPFIFVTCTYRAVNLFRRGNTLNMFCIVLMFSDMMLLELLYYITNIGSWLEIGMSLSHFIIMEAFVIILLLLYGFGYFITTITYPLGNC